jgi:hypothetical protein
MYRFCVVAGMFTLLGCAVHAASVDEVRSVKVDFSKLKSTIELKNSETDSEQTESGGSFKIEYWYHVWKYSDSCIMQNDHEEEKAKEESEVQRMCDAHEIESYKYVRSKLEKDGSMEVIYAYPCPCSPCHLNGVHWYEFDTEIPTGGGVDVLDQEQESRKLGRSVESDG